MKIIRLKTSLIITFALILFTHSSAQTTTTEQTCDQKILLLGKDATFGVSSIYSKSQDDTFGMVHFKVVGNGWCADEKGPDVVRGTMGFASKGNQLTQPESVWLQIDTTSLNRAKHPDGETLTILTDGKVVLSRPMKLTDVSTSSWTMKHFDFGYIPYTDFLKIVQGEKVIFQIGEQKAELRPKELQSIRDLHNLIQKPETSDTTTK